MQQLVAATTSREQYCRVACLRCGAAGAAPAAAGCKHSIDCTLTLLLLLAAALAEGHEYDVFSTLSSRDSTLPRQIAVEFHFQDNDAHYPFMAHTAAELALAYLHLGQLGYAPISQEVNLAAQECCSEASFFKVA